MPQENRDAAERKARTIVEDLRAAKMHTAADLVERNVSETLTYYAFPDIHWHKIRTNNPLERIMREIRRRTRVVGAFPDGQSCLNLAAARLRYIAGTAWSEQMLHEHAARSISRKSRKPKPWPDQMCERICTLPLSATGDSGGPREVTPKAGSLKSSLTLHVCLRVGRRVGKWA